MDKKILLFFILLGVFLILMFLPSINFNTENFFFSFLLSNRVWFFIVIGFCLFLYGKQLNIHVGKK